MKNHGASDERFKTKYKLARMNETMEQAAQRYDPPCSLFFMKDKRKHRKFLADKRLACFLQININKEALLLQQKKERTT